jgi:glycosyltransferase involved in cell wall biosynthesis
MIATTVRVLWISTAFYPEVALGGNVTQAWEECRALARAGATVTVLTTQLTPDARPQTRIHDGVEVHYLPRTAGRMRAFSFALTRAALREPGRHDVVHLNSPWQLANPFAAIAARRTRTPYVVSLRGTFMPWALAYHGGRKRPYLALVESPVIAGARVIIASNEREATVARSRWPSASVDALPGIVDVARFRRRPEGDLRARFAIPPDAPLALFVGRNHPVKGLDLLLEGFRDATAAVPGARLIVAGPEEHGTQRELAEQVRELALSDHVSLAGMLTEEDKVLAYHQADLVVMPSRQEGFGQVAAEAMAAGRAVIVTSESGIAPLVAEAEAGVVVPVEARAIGAAIADLLADAARRERFGRAGAAFAAARFSGDAIARRMLDLYERSRSAAR